MTIPATSGAVPNYSAISGKTFLVVDDFQGVRDILTGILRNCGADDGGIFTAANGQQAIEALASTRFDMVLCDLNLGPGKNGQQVLEEAKHRKLIGPSCAWIMISAEKTAEAVAGAAEYRPDAYLIKPITEATLRHRLDSIWSRKKAFTEIDLAIQLRNYAKAIRLCDERLVFDKANASDLMRTKAELALASGNLGLARSVYEAILAERDVPWALAGLAKVHIQDSELEQAKALLEQALRDNPTYLEAHDLLATVLQSLGNLEAAAQFLEHAAQLSPNSVARQKMLGDVALRLGRLDSAERAFRKSVNLGEHSIHKTPDAYLGLAKACSAKSDSKEALRVLDQLRGTFDDENARMKALAVEGVVHHQSGNADKACQIARELDEKMTEGAFLPGNQGALDVARLFLATGAGDRAMTMLQDQVKNCPDDNALIEEVKEIFNNSEMAKQGSDMVETSRREGMEMMNRGVLLAHHGKYEDAIAAMRDARRAMPANTRVLFNLAYVIITRIQQMGSTPALAEEARNTLYTAEKLSPGQPRYMQLTSWLEAVLATVPESS